MPACAALPATKKLILILIDGLTPSMFEGAVERGSAPSLWLLAEHGGYRRSDLDLPVVHTRSASRRSSPAPIPTCMRSRISSGGAAASSGWSSTARRSAPVRAAGTQRSLVDTVFGLNAGASRQRRGDGLRGPGGRRPHRQCGQHHPATAAGTVIGRPCPSDAPAFGPRPLFLLQPLRVRPVGAPLSVRNRAAGSTDAYAAAVGRWLVTRDGFDFLAFYLSDYDYASHAQGPDAAHAAPRALRRRTSAR